MRRLFDRNLTALIIRCLWEGSMRKKRSIIIIPDYQLRTDAVEALKRYHEALCKNFPAEEVERLRLIAESLFRAATD